MKQVSEIINEMELTWLHYFSLFTMCSINIVSAFNNLMTGLMTTQIQHECRLIYPNESAVGECEVFRNGTDHNETVPCQNGYKYTFPKLNGTTNIVSEWNLVCDRSYVSLDLATIYFSGVALGSIVFGIASDRFGRKVVALTCMVMTLVFTWATCFVTNFTAYTVIKWFSAFFTQGMEMANYCLLLELVPARRRPLVVAIMETSWGLGTIFTGCLGMLMREWRWLNFTGNTPLVVIFVVYLFLVPESIRWLINNGKMKEAEKYFHNYIGKTTPAFHGVKLADILSPDEINLSEKTNYNITHLFRTPKIRTYTLCLTWILFSMTMNFWGIIFGSTEIGEHVYINTIIGGAFELIPYFIANFYLTRFGRKRPLIFFLSIAGVCVFIAGWLPRGPLNGWIPGTSLLIARIANAGCWTVIYMFAAEVFPTNIRNLGMNQLGFWSRIAEMASPQVMRLSEFYYQLNYICFGLVCLIAAGLVFLLPETNNKHLPDTIEQAENLGKKSARSQPKAAVATISTGM